MLWNNGTQVYYLNVLIVMNYIIFIIIFLFKMCNLMHKTNATGERENTQMIQKVNN